ncbi:MAG TPA: phosphatase PAP2 family protein [Sphingomonas sp.]|nr:phosphatase PAP2 family protein [Sphingomonas sp.]
MVVAAGMTISACWSAGFRLSAGTYPLAGALAVGAAICLLRPPASFGRNAGLMAMLEGILLFVVTGMLGALLSYVAMRFSGPFTDDLLDRMDRALGLGWPAIRAAVVARPWLEGLLTTAYFACFWMPLAIVVILWRIGRIDRIYPWLLANGIALAMTLAVSAFFPARAAFAFYGDPAPPVNALQFGGAIDALRAGSLRDIDLANLGGIITFPSFHAAMAVLFVWAAWPARRLRVPCVAINLAMWAAAVPIGGHYVVDLIAGSLIAIAAIMLVAAGERGGRRGFSRSPFPAAPPIPRPGPA